MIESAERKHPPSRDETGAPAPQTNPTRTWLAPVLALLGSSGVVSVSGPLTGELYWEGYLSTFGLTSLEFPAAAAQVAKFAYRSIVEGVGTVFLKIWGYLPWLVLIVAIAAVLPALFSLPKLRAWLQGTSSRVKHAYTGVNARGIALQAIVNLSVVMVSTFIVGYAALTVVVLIISPTQARQLGLTDGKRALEAYATARPGSDACDLIDAVGIVFSCPKVIVFGEKSLAVLDRRKLHRIPREGTKFSSSIPSEYGPAASIPKP